MSWLRIDDHFATNPKLLQLSRQDRWTWVEILCYCASHRTSGYVPPNIGEVLRYVTPAFIKKAIAAGLIEVGDDGPSVHDWSEYNPKDPTAAERMQRHRRNQDRNGDVTDDVTDTEHNRNDQRHTDRNETVTRAQPRAGVSVPSRPVEEQNLLPSTELQYEQDRQEGNFYDQHRLDPADELARTIAAARAEAGLE